MNGGESGSEKIKKNIQAEITFNIKCNMTCQYNYKPLFA